MNAPEFRTGSAPGKTSNLSAMRIVRTWGVSWILGGLHWLVFLLPGIGQNVGAETDRLVVVVVFDGMRPDFITPKYAPKLYGLATNGVFFRRNHSAFISTTIVNGTALATGTHPATSGILANTVFDPELDSQTGIASDALDTIRRGDL